MKVILTRDWGSHKKGDSLEIKDKSVLTKGEELGLFKAKETSKSK